MPAITVVGAGVIGRTCAFALRAAGHDVRVVARSAGVSEVAGGLWLPYAVGTDPRVLAWALATQEWLVARGAPIVSYEHIERSPPWWLDAVPTVATERGWRASLPLVEMPEHLASLWDEPIEPIDVQSLSELDGLVVNATGLASRRLADDPLVRPARGQVVYVQAAAGTPCLCDEDALTYVLPRRDVCVVGGSYELDDHDDGVRPEQTTEILARAIELVPQLADAPVLGARAGLRPVRDGGPRVERVGDVIHCYGHGGAGLTLSWGCAQAVVALAS